MRWEWLSLSLALVGATGCHTEPEPRANEPEAVVSRELPSDSLEQLAFIGRALASPDGSRRYAWSGSGFALRFRGSALDVLLEDAGNWHTVLVDGQEQAPLVTSEQQGRYSIAQGLSPGEHTVIVSRRTEASFGPTRLLSVETPDGMLLSAPPLPARHIEVVGDSISAGYGNEGQSPECSFSAATENHFHAYGAVIGRLLDARVSTIAWSGRGVVKNYNGESGETMPALYPRTLPEQDALWSFDDRVDAVIVNLGTNDFSTDPDPELATFAAAYAGLLAEIRRRRPEALILCTVGPLLQGVDLERATTGIEQAVTERHGAGDERVVRYEMTTRNVDPGCDWHPSVPTHAAMAEELGAELRRRLGW